MDVEKLLSVPKTFTDFFDNLEKIPASKEVEILLKTNILLSYLYGKILSVENHPFDVGCYPKLISHISERVDKYNRVGHEHESYLTGMDVVAHYIFVRDVNMFVNEVREYFSDADQPFSNLLVEVSPILDRISIPEKNTVPIDTMESILGAR